MLYNMPIAAATACRVLLAPLLHLAEQPGPQPTVLLLLDALDEADYGLHDCKRVSHGLCFE